MDIVGRERSESGWLDSTPLVSGHPIKGQDGARKQTSSVLQSGGEMGEGLFRTPWEAAFERAWSPLFSMPSPTHLALTHPQESQRQH